MQLTSEKITGVLLALQTARKEFKKVTKDKTNPFFKSSYADLSSILEAVEEPLNKNGIQIVQHTEVAEGASLLVTRLYHVATGEFLGGQYPLISKEQTPQGYGSAMTYARRYALVALLSLNQEDDDGNAAQGNKPAYKPTPKVESEDEAVAMFDQDYQEPGTEAQTEAKPFKATARQRSMIAYQMKLLGYSKAQEQELFTKHGATLENITSKQASALINELVSTPR